MNKPKPKLRAGIILATVLLFSASIVATVYAASFLFGLNTPKSGVGDNNGPPTNSNPYTFSVCSDTNFGEGPAVEYSVNGGPFTCAPCSFIANNTTKCSGSVFTCTIPRQTSATVQYQFFNLSSFGDCNSSRSLFTGFSTFTTDASGNPITYNGSSTQPTAANGEISGQILTEDGAGLAGVVLKLNGSMSARTITDSNGFYKFRGVETNGFYTLTPERAGYSFGPTERSFSSLSSSTDAAFTATPNNATANPLDTEMFFVRQQYVDFLGREPDQGGLSYWTGEIEKCGTDADCLGQRRIAVSTAFLVESEFNQTGSFVYRLYKGALGRQISYQEFSTDRQQVVGGSNLDAAKVAFADAFVKRAEFAQRYAGAITAESFVDALIQNMRQTSGTDLSAQRGALIAKYNAGASLDESRSLAVRQAIEADSFKAAEYNKAFVLMQYFGYLKRNPEPDGYAFWLNVVDNGDRNNYRGMVCSFITSAEYQQRFSSFISHSNNECR
jgi:hypothetical protein